MVKNAYIHIPFCKSKCKYCSFVSYVKPRLMAEYLCALKKEILQKYKNEKLQTLYIGGGTPSLMQVEDVKELLSLFKTDKNCEVTFEINPETVDYEYFLNLKTCGINRVSIGCQTFDDNILKVIGRKHSSYQAKNAVEFAKQAGFKNISIDLIYGLPEQTAEGFERDLETAVNLGIEHISLYGLKIEEGCVFYVNKPENIADDDTQADMYLRAVEITKKYGFNHYEVSNFAKKGFESKHNMNYWNNNTYYGFGAAAHGYVDDVRYSNKIKIEDYIQNPLIEDKKHKINEREKLEEEIFLGLRKMSGININMINLKFDINFEEKYSKIIKKYSELHYLSVEKGILKFTTGGVLISNIILADFME